LSAGAWPLSPEKSASAGLGNCGKSAFLLSFIVLPVVSFLLLNILLTYQHIYPFPTASYYLNHSMSNCDVALEKSLLQNNSLMSYEKGLLEKIV